MTVLSRQVDSREPCLEERNREIEFTETCANVYADKECAKVEKITKMDIAVLQKRIKQIANNDMMASIEK